MIRGWSRPEYKFDKDGYLYDCELLFYVVDKFPKTYSEYRYVIEKKNEELKAVKITRESMPNELWQVNDEQVELLYKW